MKSGLRKYKQKGWTALTDELLQLQTRETFGPIRAEYMTEEEKKDVLEILMFLKEECDGTIKACGFPDGANSAKSTTM